MVKYPNYLSGSQDDINKRLLEMILKLAKSEGMDITTLTSDVSTLKTDVGKTDTSAGSLKKRCKDIETTIGADDSAGIRKRIKDVETAIGDETTSGTILYRIKTLEDN
jgi:allophanate hydrolase subunit 1